jgi:hypothetical protein
VSEKEWPVVVTSYLMQLSLDFPLGLPLANSRSETFVSLSVVHHLKSPSWLWSLAPVHHDPTNPQPYCGTFGVKIKVRVNNLFHFSI